VQYEVFRAVYSQDLMLFVDIGGLELQIDFPINDRGDTLLHLAVSKGR
jgi:hypothetical protein